MERENTQVWRKKARSTGKFSIPFTIKARYSSAPCDYSYLDLPYALLGKDIESDRTIQKTPKMALISRRNGETAIHVKRMVKVKGSIS
jgi:hypothetical protein